MYINLFHRLKRVKQQRDWRGYLRALFRSVEKEAASGRGPLSNTGPRMMEGTGKGGQVPVLTSASWRWRGAAALKGGASDQTENELPQPQVEAAFGLSSLK